MIATSRLSFQDSRPELIIGVLRDVTEQRLMETALKDSQDRFRILMEALPVGVYQSFFNNQNGYSNSRWAELTGYNGDAFADLDWMFIVHPEDRERIRRKVQLSVKNGNLFSEEYRIIQQNDRVIWVFCQVIPTRDEGGEVIGFLATMIDITVQKELESRFRQSQKMEAVGSLAGGIAHDFNNLLTAINGYSEQLIDELDEHPTWREMAVQVFQAGQRAAGLTRQLLAYSRKQFLQPELLDLNVLIGEMSTMLKRIISEDIRLETRPADRAVPVRADRSQLEQVLLNLSVNARDAVPPGGLIRISTAVRNLNERFCSLHENLSPGAYAELRVRDDGIGIPQENLKKIFDPFFTTKAPGKGTGLGLAMVYGIIRQTGGEILVESHPGRGTSIRILLRLEKAEEAGRTGKPRPEIRHRFTGTVLVVEDEAVVREMAVRILQGAGFSVLEAESGDRAMEMIREGMNPPELLLTDVIMPGIQGQAFVDAVRSFFPEIRIVCMSGYAEHRILEEILSDPEICFIQKPFSASFLLETVRTIIPLDP